LSQYVGSGDLLIDLAWNIDSGEIIQWCHDHNVLYINTSVELWDPYEDAGSIPPADRTLYVRHMALRRRARSWSEPGPTAVVEHGANPGLVSHWVKVGLEDIAQAILPGLTHSEKRAALERALADHDYAWLSMLTASRLFTFRSVIHRSVIDQKAVNEFVNTRSIAGPREEGVAPAEMGWGTHEKRLPQFAHTHQYGPCNQICLAQMGMNTLVRSWVPTGGEIIGMVIRHGEAFTISDHLTVWEDERPIYRPTVHYAYLPTDAAIASLTELKMRGYRLQPNLRIMNDEITDGMDELGVLLLGHELNGWWIGSQLDIHETRRLVQHQNATTLQVAASVLSAAVWMIRNPRRGLNVPDDLPHREILEVANPYLGPCPSLRTDWTPLQNRFDPFENFARSRPAAADVWQFETFRV
jgi:homospermidine synthase